MSDKSSSNPIGRPQPARSPRRSRTRPIAYIVVSIVRALGAFVPCLVNVLQAGQLDWALYPLGAILMAWSILAPWFLLRQHRAAASWGMAIITVPAFISLVAALSPVKGWFLPLGLPAALLGLEAGGGLVWLWRYSRLSAWYAIAVTFLILGILTFLEHGVARPFLLPDPYASIRTMVAFSLVGAALVFGLLASLVRGFQMLRQS